MSDWLIVWVVVAILSHRKSGLRTVAIIGILWCLLTGCSPATHRHYSFREARQVERQSERRKAMYTRRRHRTHRQLRRYYYQQQRVPVSRQQLLSELDAAAHQQPSKNKFR